MKGRPSIFECGDVILKAQQVFWKKGYTATSLPDLLAATGMGSGSFYNTFKGGKKELFQKVLWQRREAFEQFKIELAKSERPVDLIKGFFLSIATSDKQGHLQGCIVANAVMEMGFVDNDLQAEAVAILKEVEEMFVEAIAKAQEKGMMKNETEPAILGRYLITLWNGMNVTRRMHPDNKLLKMQIEMQLSIIV